MSVNAQIRQVGLSEIMYLFQSLVDAGEMIELVLAVNRSLNVIELGKDSF